MKFTLKPVASVLVLALVIVLAGCGGGGGTDPDPKAVQLDKLNGTWKVGATGNVQFAGKSVKSDYANFTLTLSGTADAASYDYTTQGRPALSAWPSSGKWTFGTTVETDVIRDPGVAGKTLPMTYSVTDTQLQITFNYDGTGEARTEEVKGQWIFTLIKQ